MVRAFDAKGRTQPEERDPDRGGYIINEVLAMDVVVEFQRGEIGVTDCTRLRPF